MTRPDAEARVAAALAKIAAGSSLACFAIVAAAHAPGEPISIRKALCIAVGVGFAAAACALRFLRRLEVGLAFLAVPGAVTVALAVYLVLPIRLPSLDVHLKSRTFPPVGIWVRHERYGFGHRPNARGHHEAYAFSVDYSTDADGCRTMPDPPRDAPEIRFGGCSVTFGYGVENDETFAYRLAQGPLARYRVKNCAVSGWGTTHNYLAFLDALGSDSRPPRFVYLMIRDHVRRNFLRKDWLEHLDARQLRVSDNGASEGGLTFHPHFEPTPRGVPRYVGLVGLDQAVPRSDGATRKEIEITVGLLVDLDRRVRERKGHFVVVALPEADGGLVPEEILARIRAAGVTVIDLSSLALSYFSGDPHPDAQGHAAIAEALSRRLPLELDADVAVSP